MTCKIVTISDFSTWEKPAELHHISLESPKTGAQLRTGPHQFETSHTSDTRYAPQLSPRRPQTSSNYQWIGSNVHQSQKAFQDPAQENRL